MKAIHTLSLEEWKRWMQQHQFPTYRAKQLYECLWKRNLSNFDQMLQLPKDLRAQLESEFFIESVTFDEIQESQDGSVKYAVRMGDAQRVEMVLIPSRSRTTLCVSSQVGCPLNCRFCATANLGFTRNLTAYEMYAQVFMANQESLRRYGRALSNIVWMGMGEPLLNFDEVKDAIHKVISAEGLAMSPSRITLSTSGVCEGILRMAEEMPTIHLAISLHTADAAQRPELMPVGKKYSLSALSDALANYHAQTNQRITIEYMLLKGLNDTPRHATYLLKFCRRFPVKINIIEYNSHPYAPFQPSNIEVQEAFVKALEEKNLIVNVRRSKGRDIAAACGQLVNTKKKC